MGGRCAVAGKSNAQMDLSTDLQRQEIEHIRLRHKKQQISSEVVGDRISGSYGGSTEQKNKHKQCQCCIRYSLPTYSEYEICPVCGWIDDTNQNANPDLASGSNLLSLKEARRRWHSLSDGEEKG